MPTKTTDMNKITIKDLVTLREKNKRTKVTFMNNLLKEKKENKNEPGGDYWISCLSAIRNTFKNDNPDLLDEKIEYLRNKINASEIKTTKDRFQKNIDILNGFKDIDAEDIKPNVDLTFLKKAKHHSIIDIKGFPIEAKPCFIFSFSQDDNKEIGGIWFIAKKNGFKRSELGMFSDMIFRYLDKHYSKNFYINPTYCVAVDLFNGSTVNYSEIKNGEIPILIDSTIDDIKNI